MPSLTGFHAAGTHKRCHCHHALDALQLLLHELAIEESLHVLKRAELLVEACIAAKPEVRHQPAPLGEHAPAAPAGLPIEKVALALPARCWLAPASAKAQVGNA